jgi:hypothetical protein
MPIPHDQLQRWWIEVAAVNPSLVNDLRPSLIAFMGFGPGRKPDFAGTGFVIAGGPEFAAVITAKHVLVEGIARLQQSSPSPAPSALFFSSRANRPSLHPEKLKATWMGFQHVNMMNVAHVAYNDTLDIACCIIAPQELHAAPFQPISIPIDTAVPNVGEVTHMVSLDNMNINELVAPTDYSGKGQQLSVTRRVSIRIGVVTGVYPTGLRQYKWPCFTTSIPAEPGMSGGFVFLPRDGKITSACGIVSADNSPTEARSDQLQCGESVIACAWPALALPVPDSIPSTPTTPTLALLTLMRAGRMEHAVGGIDCVELLYSENGDCIIGRR